MTDMTSDLEWHLVGSASDIDDEDVMRFDLGEATYAVYNTPQGYFATDGLCTHEDAHLADAFENFHGVKINRDHLIAGAVLQDASKVVETEPDPEAGIAQTETGKSLPHAFWAAHVALQKGIPESVVHIILTHTPQSPRFPESLEGKILYYVDQLDMIAIYKDRWRKDLFITK